MSTANTAILVAIVAFVSTILGATIGPVTNHILAVRRARADRDKEKREHAVEVKRAARLLDSELANAQVLAGLDSFFFKNDADNRSPGAQLIGAKRYIPLMLSLASDLYFRAGAEFLS
jgi:hypothetical protein